MIQNSELIRILQEWGSTHSEIVGPVMFTLLTVIFYFIFFRVKHNVWADFYASYSLAFKENIQYIVDKYSHDAEVSRDVLQYVLLVVNHYEDFVNSLIHSELFFAKNIGEEQIRELRKQTLIFMSSLTYYSYLRDLEHINSLFIKQNKDIFLDIAVNLIFESVRKQSKVTRCRRLGNLLLTYLIRMFDQGELPYKQLTDTEVELTYESKSSHGDIGMLSAILNR